MLLVYLLTFFRVIVAHFLIIITIDCLIVHTYVICHEKHTANVQMKLVNMVRFH